ncbi:type II secretion system protein GspG [bacterium]|nr:type II secretion system protein GspG [bacterium]
MEFKIKNSELKIVPKAFGTGCRGFTLIELLVVVAIITLLASIIVPNYFKGLEKSKMGKAQADVVLLRKSVDLFRADNGGDLPASIAVLVSGKYLSKAVPKDPWGGDYVYTPAEEGGSYTITDGSSKGISETINF